MKSGGSLSIYDFSISKFWLNLVDFRFKIALDIRIGVLISRDLLIGYSFVREVEY